MSGGWGFADAAPLAALELGSTWVVPNDDAVLRLGFAGRLEAVVTEYSAPIPLGGVGGDGTPSPGLLPGGMVVLEFEWGTEAPFTLRAAGGVGSIAAAVPCSGLDLYNECVGWRPGFLGGLSARARLRNGIFLEALAGPSLHALVGYGFPVRRRIEN